MQAVLFENRIDAGQKLAERLSLLKQNKPNESGMDCMSAFDTFDREINRSRMDEFLAKPNHISHLLEVIKKHLALIQYN